jgi:light-regulated signal transduction histidine kinase (bacteriophytochrome)
LISDAAARMGTLIDDLLAFSRIGRTGLKFEPVSLNDLIREIRGEAAGGGETAAVTWRIDDLPVVRGDRALLRVAFVNLISNAIKYSSKQTAPVVEVGSQRGRVPGTVVVSVRDNGVGFDMAYAQKLFGVFQRLHSSDDFEGTGIGLANVRRVIERHGGEVWAEGQVNAGATFFVSLPLAAGSEDRPLSEAAA